MIDLRFALESDLPELMTLINRAYQIEKFFKLGERTNPEELRAYFQRGQFLVSEQNGKFAGSVFVELNGDRGYLGLLSVDPSVQGTGLGRRLIAAAEEFARERGALHMDLTIVNLREELPAFYGKFGYTPCGTEPFPAHKPVSQPCHFIRFTKPLGKARELASAR
jgi:GNAT superfamily N-acetyltransferase